MDTFPLCTHFLLDMKHKISARCLPNPHWVKVDLPNIILIGHMHLSDSVWLGAIPKMDTKIGKHLKYIGLCAQNMLTILGSKINIIVCVCVCVCVWGGGLI